MKFEFQIHSEYVFWFKYVPWIAWDIHMQNFICSLTEIQIVLGTLFWFLLNMATLILTLPSPRPQAVGRDSGEGLCPRSSVNSLAGQCPFWGLRFSSEGLKLLAFKDFAGTLSGIGEESAIFHALTPLLRL